MSGIAFNSWQFHAVALGAQHAKNTVDYAGLGTAAVLSLPVVVSGAYAVPTIAARGVGYYMAVTGGSGVVIGNYPQYVDAARKLAKAVSSFGTSGEFIKRRISRVRRVSVLASVMRKVIAKLAFMYGCIAFLLSTGWYVMALAGNAFWTLNPGAAATVIAIHGSVITLTFHREPLGNHWESVLAVTWRRIRAAKLLLWAAFLNFLLCFAFTLLYEARAVPLIVASLAVLSSAYIVLHWALRPENLFSEGFLQTMASPIRLFFRTRRPPRHLR